MRIVTLVVALAAVCTASPALAQALILTVQNAAPVSPVQHPDAAAPTVAPPPAQAKPAPPSPQQAQQKPAPAAAPTAQPKPPPASPSQAQQKPPPAPPPVVAQQPPPPPPPPKTQARARVQPPPPPPPPGALKRFSFNRVDGGFLRFDHVTGQVAFCNPNAGGWACQAVPEERAALEKEIGRLQAEIAALKKRIAILSAPPPPPRPPAPVPPKAAPPGKSSHITQPNRHDLERARAYLADTWHRLVDMIDHWQKTVTGRGDGADGLSRT